MFLPVARGAKSAHSAVPGLSPDWQLTCASLLTLTAICAFMKCIGAARSCHQATAGKLRFAFTPLVAPTSLARSRPLSELPAVLRNTVLLLGGLVLTYWLWWRFISALHPSAITLGYMAVIPLLLLTSAVASLLALAWSVSGRLLPRFHENPPGARSISDFWGCRWNLWFSD